MLRVRGNARKMVRVGLQPALALVAPRRKRISAMVRIYNEEEWLYQSIHSIADSVDQIVLIDNLSDDATPEIITNLERELPGKIKSLKYPFRIARVGAEQQELLRSTTRSPRFLSTYYNWCMNHCDYEYILKWDGDMVALSCMSQALYRFRTTPKYILTFGGINVHPFEDVSIEDGTIVPKAAPYWDGVTKQYIDNEVRVFPKRFAHYYNDWVWEGLGTPYDQKRFVLPWPNKTYLHLPLRKRNPFANHSASSFHADILAAIRPGSPLTLEAIEILRRCVGPVSADFARVGNRHD